MGMESYLVREETWCESRDAENVCKRPLITWNDNSSRIGYLAQICDAIEKFYSADTLFWCDEFDI